MSDTAGSYVCAHVQTDTDSSKTYKHTTLLTLYAHCIHVCMRVGMHVCMRVGIHVCMRVGMHVCMRVGMHVCMRVGIHVCMRVGIHVCMRVGIHVCMRVGIHVCMRVGVHVCMRVGIGICKPLTSVLLPNCLLVYLLQFVSKVVLDIKQRPRHVFW